LKNIIFTGLLLLAFSNVLAQTDNQDKNQPTVTNQTGYSRPEADQRFKKYLNNAFGPTAFIGPVFSAGIRQINNRPEEWGKNSEGFARRFGDSIARNLIKQTVTYSLDEAFKLDSNYYHSTKKDFGSRFSNSVVSAFTSRNSKGKRVVGVPIIVGTYSAAIIANETWMPKRFGYRDGLRDGSVSMLTRIGVNLMREFLFKKK